MRLAIDIDGVLRDFVGALVAQYKKDYPEHEVGFINQWNLHPFFPIGKEIYDYAFKRRAREIFTEAEEIPGAHSFVLRLKERGHHICLLTTQPRGNEKYTLEWLNDVHGIPYDSIVFTGEKGLFDYDVLLDDGEHNLRNARESGKRAICFDQPYNQNWDGQRIKSWAEFEEIVNGNS